MPAHSSLTGADLHEPKGAASATSGQVYVADGAGSGTWQKDEGTDVASTGEDANKVLTANGSNGATWEAVDTTLIDSTGVDDKRVLVADGSGGVAWQELAHGGLYFVNRTTPVTITGSGGSSDVKVSDVLTTEVAETHTSSEFSVAGTGILTYDSGSENLTKHVHIACTISADLASAATHNVVASLYHNDVSGAGWGLVTGSDVLFTLDNSTARSTAMHADVMLEDGDQLVLALQNIGGAVDVRLYTYYLFAITMPGT